MSAVRGSRVWVVLGVVLAVVLTGATYLLVIAPARSQVASVQTQVDDATLQQTVLRHRLRDLEAAARQRGDLQARLAAATAALPTSVDTQGLLRRVQQVAGTAHAVVSAVAIGAAAPSAVEGVSAVTVTVVLDGAPDALVDVLAQLQSDASRLVTVSASSLKQQAQAGFRLSLTVQVYATTPPAAAGAAATPAAAGAAPAPAAAEPGTGDAAPTVSS